MVAQLPSAAWGSLSCLACSQALVVGYLCVGTPGVTPWLSCAQVALCVPSLRAPELVGAPSSHLLTAVVVTLRQKPGEQRWDVCAALGSTSMVSNLKTDNCYHLVLSSLPLFVLFSPQLRARGLLAW